VTIFYFSIFYWVTEDEDTYKYALAGDMFAELDDATNEKQKV